MYCPRCGQLQVSDTVRFCSRCGFLLEGTMTVLATGGGLPVQYLTSRSQALSPRSKGVRQGAMLMLSTLLVVPIVAILTVNLSEPISYIVVPLAALFCFVGGLLRILYALLMEDAYPPADVDQSYSVTGPSPLNRPVHNAALPPASVGSTPNWGVRPNTAEIYQPPSVTENTTRLLDNEEPKTR